MFAIKSVALKMTFLITLGILSIILACTKISAQDPEAATSLAHLKKFVGKYPSFEEKDGIIIRGKSLTDDQAFRRNLMKALGKNRFNRFMDELDVENPIEEKGQVIHFFKCQPHNCSYCNANVFINLADNSVQVFWHESEAQYDYWLSSQKGPRPIPKDSRLFVKDNGGWRLKDDNSMNLFNKFNMTSHP